MGPFSHCRSGGVGLTCILGWVMCLHMLVLHPCIGECLCVSLCGHAVWLCVCLPPVWFLKVPRRMVPFTPLPFLVCGSGSPRSRVTKKKKKKKSPIHVLHTISQESRHHVSILLRLQQVRGEHPPRFAKQRLTRRADLQTDGRVISWELAMDMRTCMHPTPLHQLFRC